MSVRESLSKVERGDLDVEVPVYDGSEVGLLQAGFNRMVEGLRERRKIREAFGAYVDHDVAEHVLKEGVSLEGEEVEVTVMFLDVCDFTTWAEETPAEEVVETLNGLFELAVPIIREHRGHVDKFVGDGLLAVFGAPQRADDHADRALAAALEIAEKLRRRAIWTRDRHRPELGRGDRGQRGRRGPARVQRDRRRGEPGGPHRGGHPRHRRHDPVLERQPRAGSRRTTWSSTRAPTASSRAEVRAREAAGPRRPV